jgi:hypothetical protein
MALGGPTLNRRLVPVFAALLLAPLLPLSADASGPQTLVVGPGGFASIQAAVDAAAPGDTILIRAGTYQEAVLVTTPDLVIRGEGRHLTILDGGAHLDQALTVTADRVKVMSLTAQNYASNGIVFTGVDGFHMEDLHAKDNYAYGLYAVRSTNGLIVHNSGEGHGDSAFYIGETPACHCEVAYNVGWNNMLGYSGTANSYLKIHHNEFFWNRAGILMSVLPNEVGLEDDGTLYGTQVHTEIYENYIHDNNNHTRTVGVFETLHPPVGEGITIAGGWLNDVHHNRLENNSLWGVGLFWLTTPVRGNHIHDNYVTGSRYGVWWDELGEDNCFEDNVMGPNVQVASDPDPLPDCTGPVGPLPCPPELTDWAACRASDVRPPSALKLADLAIRSLFDLGPHEDGVPLP